MNAFAATNRTLVSRSLTAIVPLAALLFAAHGAVIASTLHATLVVGGVTQVDRSQTGSGITIISNYATNSITAHLEGRAFQTGDLGVKATVSGTAAATARVTGTSQATYRLTPPAAASFAGGTFVLRAALTGRLAGNATLDLTADVQAHTLDWSATGQEARTIADQPGDESLALDVAVALPTTLDPVAPISVVPTLTMNAVATLTGGGAGSASADALDSARVAGFRVLNAAGAQVTGFRLTVGGKDVPELAAPPAGLGTAVEFYHAEFRHYFVTANAAEIANLDTGATPGWVRTGESFPVYTVPSVGRAQVCRFFSTAFAPKSSHFYAPRGLGCEATLQNPDWGFEGDVFLMRLPEGNGDCPDGTIPVYRLFNDGQGGAPNHRLTTSEDTRLDMLRDGWVAEGLGIGVGMCAPAS